MDRAAICNAMLEVDTVWIHHLVLSLVILDLATQISFFAPSRGIAEISGTPVEYL